MSQERIPGWVTRLQSGFYSVKTDQGMIVCRLRGRLKKGAWAEDVVAAGDRVLISLQSDGTGMVEEVLPREKALIRLAPTPRGVYKQVLLANPDQMALVFASANPEPHLRMLDRFLVICEKQGIPPLIVANKVDLVGLDRAREIFSLYEPVGYPVIYTSTKTGLGIDELHERLTGKLTGLAGPSGVGKTSLLNAIQPHLGLDVREVSESTLKGRHTTIVRELFPLAGGGFVADLPGLRTLGLWDTEPEELDGYFPEIRLFVDQCRFNDCTHRNEPDCAVRAAVEASQISSERYQSYLRLRFGDEEES